MAPRAPNDRDSRPRRTRYKLVSEEPKTAHAELLARPRPRHHGPITCSGLWRGRSLLVALSRAARRAAGRRGIARAE